MPTASATSDIQGWSVVVVSFLTFIAAGLAAVFAGFAAKWSHRQAREAARQVGLAREELEATKEQGKVAAAAAQLQADEACALRRRSDGARLDAMTPIILARGMLGALSVKRSGESGWDVVQTELRITDDQPVAFRTSVTVRFLNVSEVPARVDITDPVQGECDVRQGDAVILAPHETRDVEWIRTISSGALREQSGIDEPAHWLFNLRFWARDLGMNVREEYLFNGDLRFFKRDGSRLIASPALIPFPWVENIATPLWPRRYERLDA